MRREDDVRASARVLYRSASAFTLLEVMLAVTIFGIVATTIYGTFSRTLRSKALAEERIDVVRTGRTALTRMADEIAAVYPKAPSAERRFLSIAGGSKSAPLDSLYFCTLSSRGGPETLDTDQRIIEYSFPNADTGMRQERRDRRFASEVPPSPVSDTGDGGGTRRSRTDDAVDFFASFGSASLRARGIPAERLLRREAPMIKEGSFDDAFATVFLDNVASLQFRFCDGTEWVDAWDSSDSDYRRTLPYAVAIDLGLYDEAGAIHHFATAVDLALVSVPRNANITCPPWAESAEAQRRR